MSTVGSPWFTGSVMEAVNLATTKNVIFMVYINDENEESQQMNNITENSNSAKTIKDKTVALRISRDSEEAIMFGQLFTITKVPSIYLIRVGAVRDYIPGVVSEENLISRINTVASLNLSIPTSTSLPVSPPVVSSISPTTPSPPQQQSSSSSSSTTSTLTAPSNSSFQTQTSENSNDNLISRTARIQSKIEEKRKKREQEQKRAEKEREINRRTQGKAMQDVYRQQNEAKTKKIADEFAKQKKDEEEAKRRIREQIALDKAERQAKRQAELSLRQQLQQEEEQQEEIFSKNDKVGIINGSYNHSNISVRLLNGDIVRKKFQSTQTLEDVKTWIEEDRTDGKAPYNLIQNFPHRQFGINDETKSLKELNLCPSGTLICKPSKNVSIAYSSDGGFVWNFFSLGFSMIGTLLSYINPFYYFYSGNSQQQRRQFGNSNNERHLPNNNSNQSDNHNNDDIINNNNNNNNSSSSKSSERRNYGGNNVRTLSQNDDDIDKRWTYNGNSTNQE